MCSTLYLIWFAACLQSFNESEFQNGTQKGINDICSAEVFDQKLNMCYSAGLKVLAIPNSKMGIVTVVFRLSKNDFRDCFEYFDMFLYSGGQVTKEHKLKYDKQNETNLSYTFEDISPGAYKVSIQPCYTFDCCSPLNITFPGIINLAGDSFLNNTLPSQTEKREYVVRNVVIISSVACAIVATVVRGFFYCRSVRKRSDKQHLSSEIKLKENNNIIEIKNYTDSSKSSIYIFHYYDEKNCNKQSVNILKDFLEQSLLYEKVKTIEDELPLILFDVSSWLNDVLEGKSNKKIILIDTKENEEEETAIENTIFYEFIAKLCNMSESLTSYNNLFVLQIGDNNNYSTKLRNVVRRHRYRIPNHLVELCLNLCTDSDLDILYIEKQLQELLKKHPIKDISVSQNL